MPVDDWTLRLRQIRDALDLCPADIASRRDLALLLEELGEYEGALFQWRRLLDYDPNHLAAWEGVARCREAAHCRPPALRLTANRLEKEDDIGPS